MALRTRLRRRAAALLLLPVVLAACNPNAKLAVVDRATKLRHPRVPTVDVATGKELVDAGAVWVDVRTPQERSVSRIPGAIDSEQVLANPERYADQTLLAYCTIGVRSADWAAARRAEGLDVRNLGGSVMAWAQAGESFVTPGGEPTRKVHTWSKGFDWLPEGYQGVEQPPIPR